MRPTSGAVRLGVPGLAEIGYLPENPYFYDYLTAEELLRYFASLFGYSRAECRDRATRWLDEVQIGAERRLQLRRFSKGMLQRVGIAQALINDPEVVFLDEPMSGLDPIGRRMVRELILELRDRGATVFFSSHILSDAESLCSRVAILAQGRLVASGRLSDILAFELRGWELVVANLSDETRSALTPRVRSMTALAHGRYTIEVPPDHAPDDLLDELRRGGAQIVSLNPLRETLEDYFVQSVGAAATRETGL
jgi:ABC-2 type transport system ATP-binding protein